MGASKLPPQLQETPLSQQGFNSLLSLASQFRVLVKVFGLYQVSSLNTSLFSDNKPVIQALAPYSKSANLGERLATHRRWKQSL